MNTFDDIVKDVKNLSIINKVLLSLNIRPLTLHQLIGMYAGNAWDKEFNTENKKNKFVSLFEEIKAREKKAK